MDNTASDDAAARMEEVIDQFIRQDCADDVCPDVAAEPDIVAEPNIFAMRAPRPHDGREKLPRIVTSLRPNRQPAGLDGLSSDDGWRRQLIGALQDADDGTPTTPLTPLYATNDQARTPRARLEYGHRRRHLPLEAERLPFAARWCTARGALFLAVATTCVFSTGALWATHRSEMVAESADLPVTMAAAIPESATDASAMSGPPIRNTPVLVREGETFTIAPGEFAAGAWRPEPPATPSSTALASAPASPFLPRIVNGGEPRQPAPFVPIGPIAPVVRVVPIVPVGPDPSVTAAAVPTSSPQLDRDGLAERATRPVEPQTHGAAVGQPPSHPETLHHKSGRQKSGQHEPARRERSARAAPAARVSKAAPSRGSAQRKVARGDAQGWEMKRQGLRTAPEPEPSVLKKLVGLIWPFGKASTATEPVKR